jgi:hypothetical protein
MKDIVICNVNDKTKEFFSKLADLCEEYRAEILIETEDTDKPFLEFVLNFGFRQDLNLSFSSISYYNEFGADYDDIREISNFINKNNEDNNEED